MTRFGRENLPIFMATWSRNAMSVLVVGFPAPDEGHERDDRLAGVIVGLPDDGSLGDSLMGDQRRLHLGGRQPMAGDVDHVVDPADDPVIAVLVEPGGVSHQIRLAIEAPK